MCGRFTRHSDVVKFTKLVGELEKDASGVFKPHFNIAPSTKVPLIRATSEHCGELHSLTWGLIPYWANDLSKITPQINARQETAHEKPTFKGSFAIRRCLIPANGWYEWRKTENGKKEPWYLSLAKGKGFAFGGLWDANDKCGERLETCAILTTEAVGKIKTIHNRQPVIIRSEHYALWLNSKVKNRGALEPALVPLDDELIRVWPVSKAVNAPQNNTPELINSLFAN